MKSKTMIVLVYVIGFSTIITLMVMSAMLTLKDFACEGVLVSVREGVIFSGPCAADGIGFIGLAVIIYVTTAFLMLLNLWVVKKLRTLW